MLGEMAQGKNNAAIAASLVLSERAVEKHINSIFSKLGLSEKPDVHRRVKAVLVFLSEPGGLTTTRRAGGAHRWEQRGHERENRPVDSVPVLIVDDQAPFRRAAKAVLAADARVRRSSARRTRARRRSSWSRSSAPGSC